MTIITVLLKQHPLTVCCNQSIISWEKGIPCIRGPTEILWSAVYQMIMLKINRTQQSNRFRVKWMQKIRDNQFTWNLLHYSNGKAFSFIFISITNYKSNFVYYLFIVLVYINGNNTDFRPVCPAGERYCHVDWTCNHSGISCNDS